MVYFSDLYDEMKCKTFMYVPEIDMGIASLIEDEELTDKTLLRFFDEDKDAVIDGTVLDVFTTQD